MENREIILKGLKGWGIKWRRFVELILILLYFSNQVLSLYQSLLHTFTIMFSLIIFNFMIKMGQACCAKSHS